MSGLVVIALMFIVVCGLIAGSPPMIDEHIPPVTLAELVFSILVIIMGFSMWYHWTYLPSLKNDLKVGESKDG